MISSWLHLCSSKIDPAASELLTPQIVHGLEALLPTDHKLVAFDTVLCHSRPRPSYRRATRTGKWLVDEKRVPKGLQTSTWQSPWSDLCHLSQACQYRLHSRKYRDSIALKQLCHTRNSTENAAQRASLTRHILQQRRVERAQWVADLQGAASSGDSSAIAFLKLKSKRHAEWSALVEASGGQHQAAHTVQQHFKNVLAHTPLHARDDECKPFLQKLHDDMQQCQPQLITASELCMAVAKLKPGKTSGATGMSNEFVRSLSQHPAGAEQLLHLLNNMLVTGSVPQALNLGIACLIPKCVKPIQANQIRPIMLLEVLQKLYAGILMQRLRPHWPPLHAQIGAVPGGQPVEALFAAHSMLELAAVSDEPEPLFLKLDIRGAFDNLRHASVAAYLATLPKHAAYEAERLMRLLLHQTFMFSFFHEEWQLQISNGTPQGGSPAPSTMPSHVQYTNGKKLVTPQNFRHFGYSCTWMTSCYALKTGGKPHVFYPPFWRP